MKVNLRSASKTAAYIFLSKTLQMLARVKSRLPTGCFQTHFESSESKTCRPFPSLVPPKPKQSTGRFLMIQRICQHLGKALILLRPLLSFAWIRTTSSASARQSSVADSVQAKVEFCLSQREARRRMRGILSRLSSDDQVAIKRALY